jgi:hypothetical protein
LLLSLLLPLIAYSNSMLAPELSGFLGKPPAGFEKNFLRPAKQLRKAVDAEAKGKKDIAIRLLLPLSQKGELAEHASYELVLLYR